MTLWLVRCGRRGEGENHALSHDVVGVGWAELGDLSGARSLDAIRGRLQEHHPDAKPSTVTNWASQLDAFTHRIEKVDLAVLR
jgi:predicted Mrr-cat superfamily restriction endonuclease